MATKTRYTKTKTFVIKGLGYRQVSFFFAYQNLGKITTYFHKLLHYSML